MEDLKGDNLVVSNIFFSPRKLGKIPILTNIFHMGWFNHQLDTGDPLHLFLPGGRAEIYFIPGGGTEPKAVLGGGFFSYISRIHTADIGEDSSILRYLKCLVIYVIPMSWWISVGTTRDNYSPKWHLEVWRSEKSPKKKWCKHRRSCLF